MLRPGAGVLRILPEGEPGGSGEGALSVRDEKAPQILCDSAYPLSGAEAPASAGTQVPTTPGQVLYLKFPSLDHPSVRHMKLVFQMFPGTPP